MKIAYLGQMADVSRETSIAKKIRDQLLAWSSSGHDCRYFASAPSDAVWPDLARVAPCTLLARGPFWLRSFRSRQLCHSLAAWQPDLIYFRYAYHAPGLPSLFRRFPAVAEINSDDTREYAITLGPAKTFYHHLTRRRLLRTISGFVPVTQELARLVTPFSKPVEVIGNSTHFSTHPALPAPPAGQPLRIVFIGSPRTPWHGLDRIAELARLFPEWHFEIVGDDASTWTASVASPPPPNLTLHGVLSHASYLPLLAKSTAALGTFGLFRKSMHEACPLKVREYLALGLPVIGACADTDIPADADYYLRLPNDSAPLAPHRDAIAAFVARWQGRRVPRSAISHLDTAVKEAARLAFMAEIAANFRSATHE